MKRWYCRTSHGFVTELIYPAVQALGLRFPKMSMRPSDSDPRSEYLSRISSVRPVVARETFAVASREGRAGSAMHVQRQTIPGRPQAGRHLAHVPHISGCHSAIIPARCSLDKCSADFRICSPPLLHKVYPSLFYQDLGK